MLPSPRDMRVRNGPKIWMAYIFPGVGTLAAAEVEIAERYVGELDRGVPGGGHGEGSVELCWLRGERGAEGAVGPASARTLSEHM